MGLSVTLGIALVACEGVLGLDDARTRAADAGSPADVTPGSDAASDATATTDGASDAGATDAADAGVDSGVPDAAPPDDYVVSTMRDHTCAVYQRRAYCWGDNLEGQVGDGTVEKRDKPVRIGAFDDVVDISAGYTHSCLVRANSDVYCWGKNDRGQLGDGTKTDRHEPSIPSMSGAVKVGVAGWHTCAITKLRGVRCWGDNYYGALGDGTFNAHTSYVDVQDLTNVSALAVGVMHNCAVTAQGFVHCWGRGSFGQLGYEVQGDAGSPDPGDPGSPIAKRVPGLADIAAEEVAAGEDHSCVARRDGQMTCWGRNDHAQLGAGNKGGWRATPAPVTGPDLTYAVHLAAGKFTSCAVFTGGKVRCWGENNFGQLGNGNTSLGDNVPSPPIVWLSGVMKIATNEHACAWTKDRKLYCWGRNDLGQLGIGRSSDYELQPQEVTFPAPPANP